MTCKEDGCGNKVKARGLCWSHYKTVPKATNGGQGVPRRRTRVQTSNANCAEPGCQLANQQRGFCRRHYAEHKDVGTLPPKKSPGEALRLTTYRERARCTQPSCFFISRRGCRGLCKKHHELHKAAGTLPPVSRAGQGTKMIDVAGAKMSAQGWAEFFELSGKKVLYMQAARSGLTLVEEIQRRLRDEPAKKRAAYGSQVKPAPYEPANLIPPRPEPWPSAALYAQARRELRRLVAYAPDLDELVQEVFSSVPSGSTATLAELVRIGREVRSAIYGGRVYGAVSWEAMIDEGDGRHERVMAAAVRRMGLEENAPNPDDDGV